jgi:hypothetical protein
MVLYSDATAALKARMITSHATRERGRTSPAGPMAREPEADLKASADTLGFPSGRVCQQTPVKFRVMTCLNKGLEAGNLAPMQP